MTQALHIDGPILPERAITEMKPERLVWNRLKVLFLLGAGAWILVAAVMSPRIVEAWHERKELDSKFSQYADAIVGNRWDKAYEMSSERFRNATTFEQFVHQHQDLKGTYGALKRVTRGKTVVQGRGTPAKWEAEINANLEYEARSIQVVYWFVRVDGDWRLLGYRRRK